MSLEALTVVLHHSKAKHSAKLVLIGIANHYHPDDDRGAWPSQETLARYANVTDRAVRKCIDELVALGELRVESHGGPSKTRNRPNRYWITVECPDDCDRSMNHRKRQPEQIVTTGTIEPDDRNFLDSRPEPQFRRTLSEPENKPVIRSKYARPIPDDWQPSENLASECEQKFPSLRISNEVEAFKDHHAAKGSTFKDFDAAFRTWCRNSVRWQTPTQRRNEAPTPGPGKREWVKPYHNAGQHWACNPNEFPEGCH